MGRKSFRVFLMILMMIMLTMTMTVMMMMDIYIYMMQGCHTPPPPPTPWYPPRPSCGVGPVVVPFPAPPVVSLLWWAVPLALFAVVPAAGGPAHDVVLQTATRVDNRIIFDIMLNIIIVVVIFIISTIKEQLPPSPSPYNPHD